MHEECAVEHDLQQIVEHNWALELEGFSRAHRQRTPADDGHIASGQCGHAAERGERFIQGAGILMGGVY